MTVRDQIRSAVAPVYIRARLLQERLQSGVVWYPLSEEFVDDPYPTYRRLRERDPYHYSPLTGALVFSRFEDVDQILRDWRRFSNDQRKASGGGTSTEATRGQLTPSILSLDPPDHTRLRSLVNRAFTPRQVAKMEEHIRATAHALLDAVEEDDEFDLMATLAVGLPTIVIAEMIGVPPEDRSEFKIWSDHFARVLEPNLSPQESRVVLETAEMFAGYFSRIIEQRRDDPRDDLVSKLIEAEEEGERLTTEEMQVTLRLLLVAGNETTTNLIGNGLLALLSHPEQLQLLREQPGLIPTAVEELVRYDSPVQVDMRTVLEDVEFGGRVARAGSRAMLLIGGANRDPEAFADPDRLDLTRSEAGNISFGRGIHHCLGAPLARLEGRIAFEVLLERYAQIELGGRTPRFKPNVVLRGLSELPIRVRRAGGNGASAA